MLSAAGGAVGMGVVGGVGSGNAGVGARRRSGRWVVGGGDRSCQWPDPKARFTVRPAIQIPSNALLEQSPSTMSPAGWWLVRTTVPVTGSSVGLVVDSGGFLLLGKLIAPG